MQHLSFAVILLYQLVIVFDMICICLYPPPHPFYVCFIYPAVKCIQSAVYVDTLNYIPKRQPLWLKNIYTFCNSTKLLSTEIATCLTLYLWLLLFVVFCFVLFCLFLFFLFFVLSCVIICQHNNRLNGGAPSPGITIYRR